MTYVISLGLFDFVCLVIEFLSFSAFRHNFHEFQSYSSEEFWLVSWDIEGTKAGYTLLLNVQEKYCLDMNPNSCTQKSI